MNLKWIALSVLVGLAPVFASVCEDKTDEAKKLATKCKAMERGSADYNQCVSSYNILKQSVKNACEEGFSSTQLDSIISQWRHFADQCKGKQSSRCATALQNVGYYTFKKEDLVGLEAQNKFNDQVTWCADRDNKPAKCKDLGAPPMPDHAKSLEYFLEFVDKYPKETKTPNVLFQIAAVYEIQQQDEKAYQMRKRIVEQFPDNGLVPKAWLRIGEYFFMNRKFKDAVESYKKVTGFESLTGKEAALAMYHLAESYYNQADYEAAAKIYFAYIVGSDNGKYPADLRQEAMDFMAASFADMDNGEEAAGTFLKDKKVAFKDSLYYRIGMKNKDHDRLKEAVSAFQYLLTINPNYVDAPLARIAMVEMLVTQQKFEDAQAERIKITKEYDKNSSWYKVNQKYPQSVQNAEKALRSAMLDIPQYYHAQGAKLRKDGDVNAAKKQFELAIKYYNEFLQRYVSEPSWDEYKVHMQMAGLYSDNEEYSKASEQFWWIASTDTLKYGRRPQFYDKLVTKEDAAYNSVVTMDQARTKAKKEKAGDDPKKAYSLPETKAYFAQVDKYMGAWGKQKEAAELAYNAAVTHYEAEQYETAIGVLRKLKTDFPKHQYTLQINRMLAQSELEAGQLDEAQKDFEWLLVQYTKVKDTKNDSMATEIDKSIAAVLFQKADKAAKAGQNDVAAKAFLDLVKRYPSADFADKAVFEAATNYESSKQYSKAAETFMLMPRQYVKSPLTIRAILRAALAYKKDNKPKDAARTFLFITENFPQDSMAFNAISYAATTYDSIPDKKMAAQTYELAYKKYPKQEKTPALLYSACVTYDEAGLPDEAIRCSKIVMSEYKSSSYAVDAAYSIPLAYKNAKKWDLAAEAYLVFVKEFPGEKEKGIAAYYGAAQAYMELKNQDAAAKQYKNVLDAYDKYGLQIANADPAVPAEAAFHLGEFEKAKMDPIVLKGTDKEKKKTTDQLTKILKDAMSLFAKSAAYASEKWTFKATNEMGGLFVTMAAKIREQEIASKNKEQAFVERITIVQQLPTFYEQSRPIFEKNIQLARDQGFYNQDVVAAEEGYIEMFYQDCATFFEVADAFRSAPMPEKKDIVNEYIQNEGLAPEDAEMQADVDLQAYKDTLDSKASVAEQGGLPRCATGIKASAHYQIDNKWTSKLRERVKSVDSTNEALAIKIDKYDPTTQFQDPTYFKTKARLDQVVSSQVMTPEEKYATYKQIIDDAKSEQVKLKEELDLLRQRAAPPPVEAPGATSATP